MQTATLVIRLAGQSEKYEMQVAPGASKEELMEAVKKAVKKILAWEQGEPKD